MYGYTGAIQTFYSPIATKLSCKMGPYMGDSNVLGIYEFSGRKSQSAHLTNLTCCRLWEYLFLGSQNRDHAEVPGLVAINLKFLHYVPISKGKSVRRTSNNGAKYEAVNRYIDLFHARIGVDGGVGWDSLCGDILGVIQRFLPNGLNGDSQPPARAIVLFGSSA